AQRPLYEPHLLGTASWGVAPLADQQLAGLLMWVPAMLPYAWIGWRVAAGAWRHAAPAVEHRPA
ncbi:MAG TPA: cytochrome c oxidase assembly protein, partial [Burkholderiaceae bacterium]|nr:cytochrome c oxidase assembly protein [Burkholderiaceae bacterium]